MKPVRTPDTIGTVPNTPKNKHRMVRFSDWDWHAFGWLAGRRDKDRSAVLRELAHWWMRVPGAKLPERPSADEIRSVPPLPEPKRDGE